MFDHKSVPPPLSLLARTTRADGKRTRSALLSLGLAAALAGSASLSFGLPARANASAPADTTGSIQYQEAVAHAAQKYSFDPGAPATVPFQPRPGDTEIVDGAAPVALPAGQGSVMPASGSSDLGSAAPNGIIKILRREVFGFLPYWELTSTIDYDTLSTIAYFGIDLNETDGTLNKSGNGWSGWISSQMTTVINTAHAHGTRVVLTIESMAWDSGGAAAQSTLLSSATARSTAAQQIAAEVGRMGVDGVNLDFEPIASGQTANYVTFVRTLRTELDKVHPGYELTFCANGNPSSYDLAGLTATGAADAVFIMGYDFRTGSPTTTGSIDPLTSPTVFDLSNSIAMFEADVPASKIILGLPFYGRAWSTGANTTVNAPPGNPASYGGSAGVYYSQASTLAAAPTDSTHLGKKYDPVEQTGWTAYFGAAGVYGTLATWRELYFDDPQALKARLDAIDGWNLRGAGIWALGYDNNNGDGDLTNVIAAQFETGASGSTYVPVSPVRILDTRTGNGLAGRLTANTAATFQVTTRGGIPVNAVAVTGNLTVSQQTVAGYVSIGPNATNNPSSSTVNFPAGDDRANGVTVALGAGGTLSVTYAGTAAGATAQAIFDVTGYFTPDMTGATYHALTPARILDSRDGYAIGLSGAFKSHVARTFAVAGQGGVPANATAVTGNLTVTNQTSLGYLYLGPSPINNPTSSTLNFPIGDDRANAVTVALGGGCLSVTYAAPSVGPTAQVIFDVTGYFTSDASGSNFVPLTSTRIVDTRTAIGLSGKFSSHVARAFQVAGAGGVPFNAIAVTGNVTVTTQSSLGFVYVGPMAMNDPTSSTLNFPVNDDRANAVTVALSGAGSLSATYAAPTTGPTTDIIFDVTGYFVPAAR